MLEIEKLQWRSDLAHALTDALELQRKLIKSCEYKATELHQQRQNRQRKRRVSKQNEYVPFSEEHSTKENLILDVVDDVNVISNNIKSISDTCKSKMKQTTRCANNVTNELNGMLHVNSLQCALNKKATSKKLDYINAERKGVERNNEKQKIYREQLLNNICQERTLLHFIDNVYNSSVKPLVRWEEEEEWEELSLEQHILDNKDKSDMVNLNRIKEVVISSCKEEEEQLHSLPKSNIRLQNIQAENGNVRYSNDVSNNNFEQCARENCECHKKLGLNLNSHRSLSSKKENANRRECSTQTMEQTPEKWNYTHTRVEMQNATADANNTRTHSWKKFACKSIWEETLHEPTDNCVKEVTHCANTLAKWHEKQNREPLLQRAATFGRCCSETKRRISEPRITNKIRSFPLLSPAMGKTEEDKNKDHRLLENEETENDETVNVSSLSHSELRSELTDAEGVTEIENNCLTEKYLESKDVRLICNNVNKCNREGKNNDQEYSNTLDRGKRASVAASVSLSTVIEVDECANTVTQQRSKNNNTSNDKNAEILSPPQKECEQEKEEEQRMQLSNTKSMTSSSLSSSSSMTNTFSSTHSSTLTCNNEEITKTIISSGDIADNDKNDTKQSKSRCEKKEKKNMMTVTNNNNNNKIVTCEEKEWLERINVEEARWHLQLYNTYSKQQKQRAMCYTGDGGIHELTSAEEVHFIKPTRLTEATFDERVYTINELDALTYQLMREIVQLTNKLNKRSFASNRHVNNNKKSNNNNNVNINNKTSKNVNADINIDVINNGTAYPNTFSALSRCEEVMASLCERYNFDYIDMQFPPVLASLDISCACAQNREKQENTEKSIMEEELESNKMNRQRKMPEIFAILWCPPALYNNNNNNNKNKKQKRIKYNNAKDSINIRENNGDSHISNNTFLTRSILTQSNAFSSNNTNNIEHYIHPCAIHVGRLEDNGVASALAALAESPFAIMQTLLCNTSSSKTLTMTNSGSCTQNSKHTDAHTRSVRERDNSHVRPTKINPHHECKSHLQREQESQGYKEECKEEHYEQQEQYAPIAELTNTILVNNTEELSRCNICCILLCVNGVWCIVHVDLFLPCVIDNSSVNNFSRESNVKISMKNKIGTNASGAMCNFYGCSLRKRAQQSIDHALCRDDHSNYINCNTLLSNYWPCYIEKALAKVCWLTCTGKSLFNKYNVNNTTKNNNNNNNKLFDDEDYNADNSNVYCNEFESSCKLNCQSQPRSYLFIRKMHAAEIIGMLTGGPVERWSDWWRYDSAFAFDEMQSVIHGNNSGKGKGILLLSTNAHLPNNANKNDKHQNNEDDRNSDAKRQKLLPETTYRVLGITQDVKSGEVIVMLRVWHEEQELDESSQSFRLALTDIHNLPMCSHALQNTNNLRNKHVCNNKNINVNAQNDAVSGKNAICDKRKDASVVELRYLSEVIPLFKECHVCYDCRHFHDVRIPIHLQEIPCNDHNVPAKTSSVDKLLIPLHIIRLQIGSICGTPFTTSSASVDNKHHAHLWIGMYQPTIEQKAATATATAVLTSVSSSSSPSCSCFTKSLLLPSTSMKESSTVSEANLCASLKLSLIEDTTSCAQEYATHNTMANTSNNTDADEDVSCIDEYDSNKQHKRYSLLGESFVGEYASLPSIWLDIEVDCSITRTVYIIPQIKLTANNANVTENNLAMNIDGEINFSNAAITLSSPNISTFQGDNYRNSTWTYCSDDNDSRIWCSTVALLTEQPEHFHITPLLSPVELTAAIQHNVLTEVDYHNYCHNNDTRDAPVTEEAASDKLRESLHELQYYAENTVQWQINKQWQTQVVKEAQAKLVT